MAKMMELICAVYGKATYFPLKIAPEASVATLQEAIYRSQMYKHRYDFPANELTLRLAKKNGGWLSADANLRSVLEGEIDTNYAAMIWTQTLDEFFEPKFAFDRKEVHILVELPQEQTTKRFESTRIPLFTSSKSCLEILKALAWQLSHVYEFRIGFLYPSVLDVFLAAGISGRSC